MAETDIRKVKQINGWKVNHPFSFGNMFYAFLTLLIVAVPFAYLFMPILCVLDGEPTTIVPYMKGVDLIRGFFNNFYREDGLVYPIFELAGEKAQLAVWIIFLAQFGIMCISALMSVAAFVIFMVNICKGYLRHAKVVRSLSVWQFIISTLFSLSWVVIYILIFLCRYEFPNLFIWFNFALTLLLLLIMIAASINYSRSYKEVLFEKDLEVHTDGEKEVVTHVTEVHNVTKVSYEPANTLPPKLTSIGGHAFAENQYLEIANVPVEVTSLGGGAFANCLKLKVVSLPEGIKEIGYNCFFNCISLERINYAGTKEQWRHIRRGSNWLAKAKTTTVICIDGPIVVNPYH